MDQSTIFIPFFGMIALTAVVWFYMYSKRIPFIFRNRFNPDETSPDEFNRLSPVSVRNPSDNLKNLFEVPVIFYALCLYLYVADQVDLTYVAAAWVFLCLRVAHSAVHCLTNRVPLRFGIHVLSTIAVWFIAIRAAVTGLS